MLEIFELTQLYSRKRQQDRDTENPAWLLDLITIDNIHESYKLFLKFTIPQV